MSTSFDADVVIIGAGPAGSATAIWLAGAGMRVVIVEQQEFPRQKVCGECISVGALSLLDELGLGGAIRAIPGPEIRYVGWMGSTDTVIAPFPRCTVGDHDYGRAIGRDTLDNLLMARARSLGAEIVQPARVRRVSGTPGHYLCDVERMDQSVTASGRRLPLTQTWSVRLVVDAHGSWELPFKLEQDGVVRKKARLPARNSDLFAFKATFSRSTLAAGLLPVIAFPGGYGGIVVADQQRTTLACCIRRDALRATRASSPGQPAGLAVAAMLLRSCPGIAGALSGSQLELPWLSVGPIRPGTRVDDRNNILLVGNAAGESHPLIGEGINMALHSAKLAAAHMLRLGPSMMELSGWHAANRAYAAEWRAAFGSRLRIAQCYAHMAMRPIISNPLDRLLQARPSLLTLAARWAGKAHGATPVRKLALSP